MQRDLSRPRCAATNPHPAAFATPSAVIAKKYGSDLVIVASAPDQAFSQLVELDSTDHRGDPSLQS